MGQNADFQVGATLGAAALNAAINGPQAYDMLACFIGAPSAGQVLYRVVMVRAITFPAGLTGSWAYCANVPQGSVTLPIKLNGSQVGTINFAASTSPGTFTFGTTQVSAAGQLFEIDAPSVQDATFANISWSIVGSRPGGT